MMENTLDYLPDECPRCAMRTLVRTVAQDGGALDADGREVKTGDRIDICTTCASIGANHGRRAPTKKKAASSRKRSTSSTKRSPGSSARKRTTTKGGSK